MGKAGEKQKRTPKMKDKRQYERFVGTAWIALSASAFYVLVLALCRLLPYGRSFRSRSIGETLSNDTFDCTLGALYVIYAEPNAVAIAEIKFT